MAVKIRTRKQWGGRDRTFNTVSPRQRDSFVVHYDGGNPITHVGDEIPRRIEDHHANKLGWNGGGYNFVVDQQGNVYEMRGWNAVGAHSKGQNRRSIGVQVAIGGDQTPSKKALNKVRELYDEACERAGKTLRKRGHRDNNSTACPGTKLYEWVQKGFPANSGANTKELFPKVDDKKSTADLVDEVLAGQHGSGDARRKSLGNRYDEVQAAVNAKLGAKKTSKPQPVRVKTTAQLAAEVLGGLHGTGAERKKALGHRYAAVQAEVNRQVAGRRRYAPVKSIAVLAQEVIDGKHGNGPARRRSLGRQYAAVQREVNRRLG